MDNEGVIKVQGSNLHYPNKDIAHMLIMWVLELVCGMPETLIIGTNSS